MHSTPCINRENIQHNALGRRAHCSCHDRKHIFYLLCSAPLTAQKSITLSRRSGNQTQAHQKHASRPQNSIFNIAFANMLCQPLTHPSASEDHHTQGRVIILSCPHLISTLKRDTCKILVHLRVNPVSMKNVCVTYHSRNFAVLLWTGILYRQKRISDTLISLRTLFPCCSNCGTSPFAAGQPPSVSAHPYWHPAHNVAVTLGPKLDYHIQPVALHHNKLPCSC